MLLSDFGLAKRLDHGQSSYAQTANHAVGSIGWRAPECLRGEVSLDDLFEDSSQSSLGNHLNGSSSRFSGNGSSTGRHARLTKAVDLFSLGCMYFYVMTGGCHPFGDRYEREINIVRGNIIGLDKLDSYGEDGYEAKTLIERLLSPGSSERYVRALLALFIHPDVESFLDRPDTSVCMVHPMFWTAARRLAFLCDASDRKSTHCRCLISSANGNYPRQGSKSWNCNRLNRLFVNLKAVPQT
jgi:serine/threonine-protein kinase/endoribonuclease IRE1